MKLLLGVSAFHICQAHMEKPHDEFSDNIEAIQSAPVYTDIYDDTHKNYVRKTEIVLEQVC